jgi:hypothetical protein
MCTVHDVQSSCGVICFVIWSQTVVIWLRINVNFSWCYLWLLKSEPVVILNSSYLVLLGLTSRTVVRWRLFSSGLLSGECELCLPSDRIRVVIWLCLRESSSQTDIVICCSDCCCHSGFQQTSRRLSLSGVII